MEMYQIVLLVVVGIVFVVWLIDRLTNRSILSSLVQWRPVLMAMSALVSSVAAVLPSDSFKNVATILKAVCDGTVTAEDLWKMNMLDKSERNAYAKSLIGENLEKAGIAITPQVEQIIDGVIAVVCMLLPHTTA